MPLMEVYANQQWAITYRQGRRFSFNSSPEYPTSFLIVLVSYNSMFINTNFKSRLKEMKV